MGLIEEPISVYLCVFINGQEVDESKKSKVMGLWGVFFKSNVKALHQPQKRANETHRAQRVLCTWMKRRLLKSKFRKVQTFSFNSSVVTKVLQ